MVSERHIDSSVQMQYRPHSRSPPTSGRIRRESGLGPWAFEVGGTADGGNGAEVWRNWIESDRGASEPHVSVPTIAVIRNRNRVSPDVLQSGHSASMDSATGTT